MSITYLEGDATAPVGKGPRIIAHVCNDVGGWGKGFVVALSRRWPEPEQAFREWYAGREENGFKLGGLQLVQVEPKLWVANIVGQRGLRGQDGVPPIRYEAIESGLRALAAAAAQRSASVHMPRIGCGLAGGTWDRIEPLIAAELDAHGIQVTVYDLT